MKSSDWVPAILIGLAVILLAIAVIDIKSRLGILEQHQEQCVE